MTCAASCRSTSANQVRLALQPLADWLVPTLRDAVPATECLRKAVFDTLRLRLLKLGARVTETASRIRFAFAAACPKSRSSATLPTLCGRPRHEGRGSDAPQCAQASTSHAYREVPVQPRRKRRDEPPRPAMPAKQTKLLMNKTS
jgi:hypothetical protein